MNLYEAQDFFKKMYPDNACVFEFDDNCIRQCEMIMTDGLPHRVNHVEYQKVKVTPKDMPSVYIPISPHRMNVSWANYKKIISSYKDVYFSKEDLEELRKFRDADKTSYEDKIAEYCDLCGMSQEEIECNL